MPIQEVLLDQQSAEQLEEEARKRGVSVDALVSELLRRELAIRTKPRNPRGNVAPFNRRA